MKKYLAIGGAGRMGQAIVSDLIRSDEECRVLILDQDNDKINEFTNKLQNRHVTGRSVDINDIDYVKNAMKFFLNKSNYFVL